jgi:NAD(P)H-hydrate repair Nnr-like enzyme with NAD(P)H-hydrate dehydratase domain
MTELIRFLMVRSCDVTAHAHVYGRPAGAWAFEAIAAKAGGCDDVWLATRGEIAAHVRQVLR